MSKYLCKRGHIRPSQDAATNCVWCKKKERKLVQELIKIKKVVDR